MEAQKEWAIVLVEFLDQASDDQPTLGDCLVEANIPPDEGVSVASPPNVEDPSPSRVVSSPVPPSKPTNIGPSKKRVLDRVLMSTYVPPLERVRPSMNTVDLELEDVLKLILRWSPFN